ncbi:DUF1566 domain-containing protein [Nitrospira sp. NS4]|uniref:Lcl C-terminal domain-containing protein n=1 Tax=Nitrospira sp. NS4 TaxID=3414498 RepID=UPI003C2F0195
MQNTVRVPGFIRGFLSLGLLAVVALAASPAQAATSNGPYYAEPAWDQKLDAATRFVVLSNWNSQAVLDRETGLVWEREPHSMANSFWSSALGLCANHTTGGRKGWRLPSIFELASLVDPSVIFPSLPASHPFINIQPTLYWSATTATDLSTDAWFVNFANGLLSHEAKGLAHPFWCVRGGMNADAY